MKWQLPDAVFEMALHWFYQIASAGQLHIVPNVLWLFHQYAETERKFLLKTFWNAVSLGSFLIHFEIWL